MTLNECRSEIENIDKQLVECLVKRIEVVLKVAEVKLENNIEILDAKREENLLESLVDGIEDEVMQDVILKVYETILSTSRQIQMQYIDVHNENKNN